MSMNRRSFFGRVAAAAAVPALVKVASAEQSVDLKVSGLPDPPVALILPDGSIQSQRPELTIERRNLAHTHTPPPVGTHTHDLDPGPGLTHAIPLPKPFWEDRLTLLQRRGLMAPCPNCREANWCHPKTWGSERIIECGYCGWKNSLERFAQRCPCADCVSEYFGRTWTPILDETLPDITMAALTLDAPAGGAYWVCESGSPAIRGRRLVKYERNFYDVNTDDYLHHAVLHRIGRVQCAVKALKVQHREYQGVETSRQPGGNLVLLGWHMVDCYEWQVERGEKPPIVYHRDADGRTTLVQGVQAQQPLVIMCTCENWLTCEHPWPSVVRW